MNKKNLVTVLLSVLLSGLTALAIVRGVESSPNQIEQEMYQGAKFRTVNLMQTEYPDFTYAAESCVDAVVYVKVTVKSVQRYQTDPFFRYFFGDDFPNSRERESQGSGSGVIIRPDGYIVTNNHVIENASKVEVTLNNNKTYEATVVGTDAATDVALIKIEADGLPYIEFADSDNLRLGEWVIAIGSPYDLRSTITAGIVSAKGRSIPNYEGEFKIESFIQTDAAVNPGNSGGALVNKDGKLVGVNTAIISQTGSYTGYSFAVPSNIVKKITDDLIDFGTVHRVMLGVTGGNVTDELAKKLKLSSPNGVYISEVMKGSAAEKAGIQPEDVIVKLDSTVITQMALLQEKVNSYRPGDKANAEIIRDGQKKIVEITFMEESDTQVSMDDDGSAFFFGATLQTPSEETLKRLGIKHGVEVVELSSGKMQDAGASEGFIIQYVNDQPVTKPQDVIDAAKKGKRAVLIEGVTSYGRPGYFAFGKE